ncbi:MAG: GMC family oxidoreductase N-terminal domain-containing protein [Salaquimonas sp.]
MEFDYVIVGGGSAGCVLAARLSEVPNVNVCLIEAGGEGKDLMIRVPVGAAVFLRGLLGINNWAFSTTPQKGLNGRKGFQPRGKALGGSSAINAMLYVRGVADDYDAWERGGAIGWGWKDVLPYFKKSEANVMGSDGLHGGEGPLHVSNPRAPMPINEALLAAASELQIPVNDDFNGPSQEGVGYYQVTQFHEDGRQGERCSAAAAYLHPVMDRKNLHVMTATRATKILFEGDKATGVDVLQKKQKRTVRATREVILCGGAFNSPQLLLLSGIGDKDELASHGIKCRKHLPGVGKNLQDHLDFVFLNKSKDKSLFGIGLQGMFNITKAIMNWRKGHPSILSTTFAESGGFLKTDPSLSNPDIQLHFVPALVDDHTRKMHLGYGYSCHVCVLRPFSRGAVSLQSADPLAAPLIDPNYLSDERDLELLVKGAKLTRDILSSDAFEPYRHKELYLRGDESDAELAQDIRARADTIYHPVGTCKMGEDVNAVVDSHLKVPGIQGLRVVDASVMPTLIGGNTNAPTIMIAERAADLIRAS